METWKIHLKEVRESGFDRCNPPINTEATAGTGFAGAGGGLRCVGRYHLVRAICSKHPRGTPLSCWSNTAVSRVSGRSKNRCKGAMQ